LNATLRNRFDALLDKVVDALPDYIGDLLAEVPLIVEDRPDAQTMEEMDVDDPADLCGLYTGIPLTERSVQHSGQMPEEIMIYREGVVEAARDDRGRLTDRQLEREIRTTVLHEIGHHFGLDEDELRRLGYE
jgi:predicted Zn-dependent protease with MMP-like domain